MDDINKSLTMKRVSKVIESLLFTLFAINLCFLINNAILGESPNSLATSNKASIAKLCFCIVTFIVKRLNILSTLTISVIFANIFGVYLLAMGLVWQKPIFVISSEAYRVTFLNIERQIMPSNVKLSLAVHIYSNAVFYYMCYHYGRFDEIEGGFILVSSIAYVLANDIVYVYSLNYTTLKQQENCNRLTELKLQIQSIFESIPEVVFVVKKDLSIILKNDAADDVLSQTSPNFLKEVQLKQEDGAFVKLANKVEELINNGSLVNLKLGESTIKDSTYEWKVSLVSWEGEEAATLLMRDVTAIIQLEKAKHEAKLKNVMLRSVSHELRTPVNSFSNLLERALECSGLPENAKKFLNLAQDNCQHILHVINDLLDFSQFMHGSFKLAKRKFDIRQTLRASFKPYEYMIKAAGLSTELHIDPALPKFGCNDPSRISQVVMNLLSNASKFTRQGSIQMHAFQVGENSIKVSVTDTGVGISSDQQVRLCSLFGKLKENESLNPQGCGLGLHISNLLAIQLGKEEIRVQSILGVGSTFSFLFSFNEENVWDYSYDIEEEKSQLVLPVFNSLVTTIVGKVLVVDDNVFNRDIIACILQDIGVECTTACSGYEAIKLISENPNFFQLMLLDYEMPELNGPQTARQLVQLESEGGIGALPAIVAYTAYSSEKDQQECKDAGMVEFLTKPCTAYEVRQLVQKYCRL